MRENARAPRPGGAFGTAASRPPVPDLSDHMCAAAGCGAFGCFGFGPPGAGLRVRWYCGAHRAEGQAWWAGMRGGTGGAPAAPKQGSLF